MTSTLKAVLETKDTAEYAWDGYYVYVSDGGPNGYDVSVAKEAMPPHISEHFDTLEEVETWLDGTLGYSKNSYVWEVSEPNW